MRKLIYVRILLGCHIVPYAVAQREQGWVAGHCRVLPAIIWGIMGMAREQARLSGLQKHQPSKL
jgi:hypothetical protein